MDKITAGSAASSPLWETLETYARGEIQQFVQRLLEEEVEALLGRRKSERRSPEAPGGYRNGYGTPRQLALSSGTITVRRPRVRDLDERFVSRVLPLFQRRTRELGAVLPELYLHGLALGDFELALRGLLGDGAPLSPIGLRPDRHPVALARELRVGEWGCSSSPGRPGIWRSSAATAACRSGSGSITSRRASPRARARRRC